MTQLTTWGRLRLSAASLLLGVAAWAIASRLLGEPELLPSPYAVAQVLLAMLQSGDLAEAVLDSLQRVAVGYSLGAVAGVATGLLLGAFRPASHTLGPVFEFLKGIPPIALVPLFGFWMGIGETSKYAVIAYLVWIVVAISTAVGVREVPRIRVRTGAVLGLSAPAVFARIILPSSVPFILSGMRSAIGFAFVALVSAELIAANTGVGQIIMDSRFSLQTARMFVGLLVLGTLGALAQLLFDQAVARIGRRRGRPA